MMVVFGLLPLAALALFMAAMRSRVEHWTEAVVLGSIAWGTLVVVLTETLGAAHALTFGALGMVWSAVVLSLGAVLLHTAPRPDAGRLLERLRDGALRRERLLAVPVAVVAAITLLVALAAPPNTFDSMAYHMSRVAQWAAHASVDNYPTAILRQLHMAPFAEYAILHLYVLAGGDQLANLVQWSAMLASVAAVAAVTRRLGGSRRAMLLAAVFCATLPIGILEATATKNDYVLGLWLAAAAWLVLVLTRSPPAGPARRREYWLAFGAAVGLAMLTKATAYLFVAPFLVWLAAWCLRRLTVQTLMHALIAAVLALTLNAAFFARNLDLHGSPFGPKSENDEHRYANERIDPQVLASNVIRNVALQVATGSDEVDAVITRAVRRVHRLLGIDPALPEATWMSLEFDAHQRWRHEDSAPNPVHFLVLVGTAAVLIARPAPPARRRGPELALLAALAAGFLLFCAYLQWQPWHSRLHLPLLVGASPLAGLALARVPFRGAAGAAAALLLAAAGPALLRNESRELATAQNVLNTPRSVQYFTNWPDMTGPYLRLAERLSASRCTDVALFAWWNAYEYPLWALAAERGAPIRVHHAGVENESRRYRQAAGPLPAACAVVALARHEAASRHAGFLGMAPVLDEGGVLLFLPPPVRAEPVP